MPTRIANLRIGTPFSGDNAPAVRYFLEDHLGNCSFSLETTGALFSREEYFPFGETSFGSFTKKRYRFCGKERDEESGLYYYGARYYAAWTCRFVSVDPLAGEYPFYTPYQYAGNKPVIAIDLDGLEGSRDPGQGSEKTVDNKSPMPTVTGKEFQGKTSPDGHWIFLEGGDNNKRNGLHGIWASIPPDYYIQEIYNKIRDGINKAQERGATQSVKNLSCWLNGEGGSTEPDLEWFLKVDARKKGIEVNNNRFFYKENSAGESIEILANKLPNNGKISFSDHWKTIATGHPSVIYDVFNKKVTNDSDFFYAYGTMTIISTGYFVITRTGNRPIVTGTIEHHFIDTYDWELGKAVEIERIEVQDIELKYMEIYKGAKPLCPDKLYIQNIQRVINLSNQHEN